MIVDFELFGVDGSRWQFVGIRDVAINSPLRLAKAPTGLAGPAPTHEDDQNVDQAGVTWRASMYGPNVIGLPVRFGPVPPGDDALAAYLAYRDALGDGTQVGEFHVHGPRRHTFQAWRRAGELPEMDLGAVLNTGYVDEGVITLRSDESWWRTVPYEKTFTAAQFATAKVDNDSDENVWAYYEITGPITSPTIGLGGEAVALPTIGAGQTWTIETDPNFFAIRDHLGIDRTAVNRRWYTRAAAHTKAIPLTITGSGTSGATSVKVVLPQLFRSAV